MIVLVDLGDLFHRTLYNIKTLKKIASLKSFKVGVPILLERVVGILKWIGGLNSSLIICQDSFSWRREISKSYKQKRSSVHSFLRYKTQETLKELGFPPEDLKKEFNKVMFECEEFFKKRSIPVIQCPGYEADDLMALIVQHLENDFVIFGADSDLWQLVSPRVKILRLVPRKRAQIIDEKNIKYLISDFYFKGMEIYDWTPGHLVWLKLALGDKADEIPPLIPGCGPVFWLSFFKKVGRDLFLYFPSLDLFLNQVQLYINSLGKNIELPDLEIVRRNFELICLNKNILKKNNPKGFEVFEGFLKDLKKMPNIELKLLSEELRRLKNEMRILPK